MITLTGLGYDIHRFSPSARPLMLGGVQVDPSRGLDGHSDADVLCHALADAILGGHWFPPNDPSCANIDSLLIVGKAMELLHNQAGALNNVDCTLIAEAPRILSFVPQMKETLSPILGIPTRRIGIKATTNEQLGALGRAEGIAALATVCIHLPE